MASPCNNSPEEVIEKIVSAKANADKFDKFVNGTDTQTVQLGSGSPTPTIRNAVRQIRADGEWIKQFIADAPEGDVSLNNVTALGSVSSRTLTERFADIVNVKDYGAIGDGVTDDTTAILAAIAAGAAAGKKLIFDSKTYKLTGSSIVFQSGADFNGAVLDVSEMTGPVYFNSPGEGWVEDTDAMAALKSGADIDEQSSLVPGWATYYGVSNHYVHIESSQYFYTYRDEDFSRYEYNLVTDHGHLLSPIKYALDVSTVTSVKKMEFNRKSTEYSNVIIKLGDRNPNNGDVQGVVDTYNSSNVKINNLSFDVDSGTEFPSDNGFALYRVNSSGHVQIDGLYCLAPIHKQDNSASYCLMINDCYDIKIKNAIGQGAGWGAAGSNRSWRVVYEKSDLSRIDFHTPFFEYLKVKDCSIGRSGITATAVGDLIVNDTIFLLETSALGESAPEAIIRGRTELNGLCDGSVYLSNCKIISNAGGVLKLFRNYTSTTDNLKSGSPLTNVFWNNIYVNNLKIQGSSTIDLAPTVSPNSVGQTRIEYENIQGDCKYTTNYGEGRSPFNHDSTSIQRLVKITNASLSEFKAVYSVGSPYIGLKKIILDNIRKLDTKGCSFLFGGWYDVSILNSDVTRVYSISTNTTIGRSIVIENCRIDTGTDVAPFAFRSGTDKVLFKNCLFIEQPTESLFTQEVSGLNESDLFTGVLQHIVFRDNRVLHKASGLYLNAIELYKFEGTPSTSVTIGIAGAYTNGFNNWYTVECGAYNTIVTNFTFRIPGTASNRYMCGDGKYITVSKPGGDDTVTVTASDSSIAIRKICLFI